MALFLEHISALSSDITPILKSKVTEWIASQSTFIQTLFGNICWKVEFIILMFPSLITHILLTA